MIYIISCIVVGFVILMGGIFYKFHKDINTLDTEYVKDFIETNKANPSFSLCAKYNEQVLWNINSDHLLPLASTVKTIIAIEYAYQVADKQINPLEKVIKEDLDRHYLANYDGGAHEAWLKTISTNDITLNEVAKGMIAFSSNANTDFLLTKLGIDSVNNRLKALNLLDHTEIYPLVSALYVPLYLHEEEQVSIKNIASVIEKMSMQEFVQYVLQIHNRLLEMPFSIEEKVKATKLLKMNVQKALSDKLPSSTTRMYSNLMSMLNCKNILPTEVHQYLDPIMEQIMVQETYRLQFKHFGRKGGSTAFALTDTVYATDSDGNMFELAFFANNLNMIEQRRLSNNLRSYYEEYFKRLIRVEPVK